MLRDRCRGGFVLCVALVFVQSLISAEPPNFSIQLETAHSGFNGKTCWVHARAGVIPAGAVGNPSDRPRVVMTAQKLLLTGSDVFYRLHESTSLDEGASWTEFSAIDSFARERVGSPNSELPTGAEIAPHLLQSGDETTVCDFSPQWHAASQRLLGIGQSVWYRNNRVMHVRPRGIAYSVFDPLTSQWNKWKILTLPDQARYQDAGSGSQQRVDLPGGDTLVPFYFKKPEDKQYSSAVCRCRFDGQTLHRIEIGNALTVPIKRGLYEPSLTHFDGRFFLTLRNDDAAYVSVSDDGLNFTKQKKWAFDDGTDLGNYNTQQHWVTHSGALFLVYTRRGADNDHVFRHRAPLFIARVDTDRLHIIRSSERVLVPQRGARLGNFGIVNINPQQTWVIATEWMQPLGVEKHGSDNSIFIAKLKWNRPNQLASTGPNSIPSRDASTQLDLYSRPPATLEDELGDFRSPLVFNDGSQVQGPADWEQRRQQILKTWTKKLGPWPPLMTEPQVRVLEKSHKQAITRLKIQFQWTPTQWTTGYLLIPDGDGERPAVVTVFYEPETAIGVGKPHRDFAIQLAKRGFVTLSIGTTEASREKTYALYHPSIDAAEIQPLSMLAYAAANAWHVLEKRPEVDASRIGIVGHSFGGKWAMFASCLFDRFACAAWSDPGIVFDPSRPSVNYWEPWYLGYHPKPWRKRGIITVDNPAVGLYPQLIQEGYDLHELHALMAPRPFLVSGGSEDPIGRWKALNHSIAVNRMLGQEGRVMMTNRPDHSPNDDSNAMIYAFFDRYLKNAAAK